MKKILSLVLALTLAVCLSACAAQKATSELIEDVDTLCYAFLLVDYVDGNGFAGDGMPGCTGDVFVVLPDADKEFRIWQTVRIEFYGKDMVDEERTVTTYTYDDEGTAYPHEFTCSKTLTKVQNARLSDGTKGEPCIDKPIIYLYPEEDTVCSVRVDLDGALTCTYPAHGADGWRGFTAKPDGTLVFPDGSEYYALYWEGVCGTEYDFSRGFCVKGSDTAAFLADILPRLGLSAREANEFIVYWLPRMQDNAYNLIAFQSDAYTDSARLMIDPAPDTLIRVFMAYKPLDEAVEIEPQEIATPARDGFTVVEWGGSEVK